MRPDVVVIAAAVMKSTISEADTGAREQLATDLRPGDRRTVWIETPEGEVEVGQVTKTKPAKAKRARRVTDPDAFLAWVKRNRPDEVVTVEHVRESFQQVVLNRSEADDDGVLTENPPGVEWVETAGRSVIQVRPSEGAALAIASAVASGAVDLSEVLALPGGSDD